MYLRTVRTGSHGWPRHYSLTPSCMRSARPAEILHCPEFDRNIEECLAVSDMTQILSYYTNRNDTKIWQNFNPYKPFHLSLLGLPSVQTCHTIKSAQKFYLNILTFDPNKVIHTQTEAFLPSKCADLPLAGDPRQVWAVSHSSLGVS